MFAKKRHRPWFIHVLLNLFAALLIYKLARGFQKYAMKQGADKKYKGRR